MSRWPGRSPIKTATVYEQICINPGITMRELQHHLGWSWGSLTTVLTGMDNHDLLVSEDDAGRLFTFQVKEIDMELWEALKDVIAMI